MCVMYKHKRCALMMWPAVGGVHVSFFFFICSFSGLSYFFFLFSAFFFLMYRLSSRGTNQPERKRNKKQDTQRWTEEKVSGTHDGGTNGRWGFMTWASLKAIRLSVVHSDVCSVQFPRDVSTCVMPTFAAPLFIKRVAKEVGERTPSSLCVYIICYVKKEP